MKALVYHHSPVRYVLGSALTAVNRRRFFASVAPLTLKDVDFALPEVHKGRMLTLKVRMCGICGSDINLLKGVESLLLEPYASFPAILGHETLAEVAEAPEGSGFGPGDRVVVEPVLACAMRGLPLCPSCRNGDYNLCENFTRGDLAAGPVQGFNATLGGGMAETTCALPEQLVRVPDNVSDEDAVLVDSIASALQPVLNNFPSDDEVVVIYGAGVIGQNILRCLRSLGSGARIIVIARYGFQRDLAEAGGADEVLMSPDRKALGKALGAEFLPTTLKGGNLEGGATMFYDCVGSSRAVQEGLLCLRARGRYVMVATAGMLGRVDVSSIWFRQLTVTGTSCYSRGVTPGGEEVRTYQLAMDILAGGSFPTAGLLTHTFALDDYGRAFQVSFNKRGFSSCKTAFDLRNGPELSGS